MAVTLKDIGKRAGVTPSVVSHVLNNKLGHTRVSAEKQRLIRKIANELGYVSNLRAKSMITRKSYTIGLICSYSYEPDNDEIACIADSYVGSAFRGVDRACKEVNYHCIVSYNDLSNIETFVFPRAVKDSSIDGVVLLGYTRSEVVKKFSELGIPCTQIGVNIESKGTVDCIYADLNKGFAQTAHYLADMGHKKIVLYLPDGPGSRLEAERFRELDIDGVEIDSKLGPNVDSHIAYTREYAKELLKQGDIPTAFIMNMVDAMGLAEEFAKVGLECPRDYSIVYYTADITTRHIAHKTIQTPVSVIRWDGAATGYLAAKHLLARLGALRLSEEEKRQFTVPCELIPGNSCERPARFKT